MTRTTTTAGELPRELADMRKHAAIGALRRAADRQDDDARSWRQLGYATIAAECAARADEMRARASRMEANQD